ncbi:MAG: class I SAM-dependent methyltransferase [Pseudomonadota bacterium]
MGLIRTDLSRYFESLTPDRDELLLRLEKEGAAEGLPLAGPVVGRLLFVLAAAGARNILELGTCTGYTAIHLARGAAPRGGRVISLESEPAFAARARDNIAAAGLAERVEVREGDALALLARMDESFDLAFLDIDKDHYAPALPHLTRLVRPGGLLLVDNVGFKEAADFNALLHGHEKWRPVFLLSFLPLHTPERDGLCLAARVD